MRYAWIIAWAGGIAASAAAEYDPADVLRRAMQKALASAQEIPNYTCVENVTRDYYEPATKMLPRACPVLLEQRHHPTPEMALRLFSTDRLRLDVTLASQGELYSWSGASRFDDAGVDHVVRHGPVATGSFGGFLIAVFETDAKKFTFDGNIVVNGRIRMGYSFQVAPADSHFRVKIPNSWVIAGYSGTFWVDPETCDVVEIAVMAKDLPLATGLCLATATIDLARVTLGDGQFLMPRQAWQRFVYASVEETENTTSFSNCREFRGDSTVTFFPAGEAATENGAHSTSVKSHALPAGLPFSFTLATSIPTDDAAAGDPFSGKLVDPIRQGRRVLAPRGTLVEGHLVRVQSFIRPAEVVVVLKPEALRIHGARVPLNGRRDWAVVLSDARKKGEKGVEILVPLRGEDKAGVFRFAGEHVIVPSGFRSDWKTVSGEIR